MAEGDREKRGNPSRVCLGVAVERLVMPDVIDVPQRSVRTDAVAVDLGQDSLARWMANGLIGLRVGGEDEDRPTIGSLVAGPTRGPRGSPGAGSAPGRLRQVRWPPRGSRTPADASPAAPRCDRGRARSPRRRCRHGVVRVGMPAWERLDELWGLEPSAWNGGRFRVSGSRRGTQTWRRRSWNSVRE